METKTELKFSQKHPLFFGFLLIMAAMVLIIGAMAAFTFFVHGDTSDYFVENKLGVVHVRGTITESRSINDWIQRMAEDKKVKGVILRIDSPGGEIAPSQEIYSAVKRLAAKKKVVASFSSMATSGGYYVACGADVIVSNPGSLTGSIGVKAKMSNFQGLMQKLGIREETITSGKYKDAGSAFKPLTPEEKAYFQKMVDNLHMQFVHDVASSRELDEKEVLELADGRALTGEQARNAGLVDRLGGFHTAKKILRKIAHISNDYSLVEGPPQRRSLLQKILGSFVPPKQVDAPRWEFFYE